ncbi:PREDICTED: putative late blight resistance protein homolog R1B-14 [Ipomoea nil]|uniref:putative late blight resistance protein homolog R1B-14 n=1 Tax=Ipomoea nil TaxID=35883 RepID=UPI000901C65E|nr:PREDICTED: putative late blight resistance protein homolog R1B-14 [Ipomoea nil]XP_019153748.1 PREDICTED: putative late blight resistance protein homolog R1B-14 [Ipomoea nil]XP_019153749.1 PREDICTED: putative late blight resistance protein homolog R1B-14 [Ipomoea nil]XP_019153751.1 PREDICTED: putative late blight resistance protein homolog R1B-14 [Ipomoea nil]XP_019153752.1 PREDICTED: putative late blight resistance protein homolog R1B-14 [Ipomoea nil]
MAYVVVTSLLGIVDHQLLKRHPPILDDTQIAKSLSEKLGFVQAILSAKKTINQELEAKIRDIAVEAEAEIESQLGAVYLANEDSVAEASDGLHQILRKVLKDIDSLEVRIQNEKENNPGNKMIGCEDEFGKIMSMVVGHRSYNKDRIVIPITGMGGIGKTTLAKKVYNDPLIMSHFEIRAWTVVSQEYQLKEMLIHLLHCTNPKTIKLYSEDCGKLKEELRKSLLGRRYLLVIDDIWSHEAWDEIIRCFPDNINGSRILITTREKAVAKYAIQSSKGRYIHSSRFLDTQESWDLFETKVFGRKHSCKPKFEPIGRCIVNKCQGLPLAIIVIAGVLAALDDKSPKAWQDVFENMNSSFDPDKKLLGMLSLSYNYLPSHLKACLIYLGVFLEDSDIPVSKLINLWVAEGFLKEDGDKNLEQVAESYLHDLINRNLVQVSKQSIDGKLKSCKLHDMLYDLCRKEAERENFLSVEKKLQSRDTRDCRWISGTSTRWPTSHKVHSILYFGKDVHLAKSMLVFSGLKMLRVLDLSLIKCWYGLPIELEDLVHLRYLSLSALGSIANFKLIKLRNLQTLIFRSWKKGCRLQLPRDILELPWLRHVHIDKISSLYLPQQVQENLQTLLWLKVIGKDSRTTDFTKVPKLKELWVYIDNELLPSAFDSLVKLNLLEKLKIEMRSVKRFYFPTSLPENLKKLTLRSTYLPWKDMDIIRSMQNLEVLKLKNFAFYGPEWKLEDGLFPKVKHLVIAHSNLKCWNADAENFPKLECLILKFCWDLKKLPIYAFSNALRLIEIDSCYPSLVKSAEEMQKEQQELGNDAFVIRDLGAKIGLPYNENSEEENESCE